MNINLNELEYKWAEMDKAMEDFFNHKKQNPQKPLILFGAGSAAKQILNILESKDINIDCIIDSSERKWGTHLSNKPVVDYDSMRFKYNEYDILLADSYLFQKQQWLTEQGEKNNIFLLEGLVISSKATKISNQYYTEKKELFLETYNMLTDQQSRDNFITTMKRNLTGNLEYVRNMGISLPQYFQPELHLSDKEVFVDCGAYSGDTVESFISVCTGYNKIFSIEADLENFKQLEKNVNDLALKNVYPINTALYSEETVLRFFSNGTVESRIINENENTCNSTFDVVAKKLDNVLSDEKVSFIKMDIEGGELAALKGAECLIKANRPKLAICVYHRYDDLITIPQYIKSLIPDYKFYLRLHALTCHDVVLYAV